MWIGSFLCIMGGYYAGKAGIYPLIFVFGIPGIALTCGALAFLMIELCKWHDNLEEKQDDGW